MQRDALIHEEPSGLFGLYSTRERCLGLVLKSRTKGWGGLRVCLGEGEAGSSTTPDLRPCCAVQRAAAAAPRALSCLQAAGLLASVPSAPAEQTNPRGFAGGVLLRSAFSFGWAGLCLVSSRC